MKLPPRCRILGGLAAAAACTLSSGCLMATSQRTRESMQHREDFLLLREDLRQMSGRMDDLRADVDELWRQIDRMKVEQTSELHDATRIIESNVRSLEETVERLQAARGKDRQEILDEVSKTVAEVVKRNAAASGGRTRISEYGVEHTVGPGETLSEIAAAYGVSMPVLIQANTLKNPDSLRVGQTLFIPE
jgi:LysM repeat protein